jgi:uncharacterized protein
VATKLSKPLTEKEIITLAEMLSHFPSEKAMSFEAVDGFFTALHCSPNRTGPGDYLSLIWGDETGTLEAPFEAVQELHHFMELLMRHWNEVGCRFQEPLFTPYLWVDETTGKAQGTDWAKGFLTGTQLAQGFEAILQDEKENENFFPIFALAYEHEAPPNIKPFRESAQFTEERDALIDLLCLGVTAIYHYFSPHRKAKKEQEERNPPKDKTKRHDMCYCGSGISYKKCCLQPLFH